MKQLGYTDSIFVSLETPSTPQHVGFLGIYDPSTAPNGMVRFKEVLANFEQRLKTLPTFRTRLVQVPGRVDRPYWVVDDSFDVEYHIRHVGLPQPGDWRQLCIQIARLHSRGLDMKRPLWECDVIEGINNVEGISPGAFAVYVKIHHSMVDGDLGQRVMAVLHDLEPDPVIYDDEDEDEEEVLPEGLHSDFSGPALGDTELLTRAFTNRVKNVIPYTRTAVEVVGKLGDTLIKMAKQELPPPAMGPKTRFDEPVGPHRVVEAADFDLNELKAIKDATGTTINDVCVTICSGALRKYLDFHGELPADSLVANMPVNMRKRGIVSDENNQVAALMAKIHTEIADPIDRLHMVHESIGDAKKFIGTPIAEPLKMVGLFPPFMAKPLSRLYAAQGVTRLLPAGTPCVITNVPGPPMDLYLNGAHLRKMHLLGLLTPGVGLFHAIFSLCDRLSITVLSDRDMLPDPAFYRQCLEESFTELRDAVMGKPKPKAAAKAAAPKKKAAPHKDEQAGAPHKAPEAGS